MTPVRQPERHGVIIATLRYLAGLGSGLPPDANVAVPSSLQALALLAPGDIPARTPLAPPPGATFPNTPCH